MLTDNRKIQKLVRQYNRLSSIITRYADELGLTGKERIQIRGLFMKLAKILTLHMEITESEEDEHEG